MQQFVSDNNAGMCPQAVAAMLEANGGGHAVGYGDDPWTAKARAAIEALFETPCAVFFVYSGTGANALSLAHLSRSYHAVIAHRSAHVAEDETGAPEFFSGGAKVLGVDTPLGKVTPEAVDEQCGIIGRIHTSRPRVVSLTQATEMGTVYRAAEIAKVAGAAHRHGLKVHMDGARFANAVARLRVAPADVTWRAGVDVLSLGGTKNGLGSGEAVVFFDTALADEFPWRVKQAGQLNSKMRLMSAPWLGLLADEVWLNNARHANAMADRLAAGLAALGLTPLYPTEANGVFVEMSPELQQAVRAKGWQFITFFGQTGCRLMCAWDTAPGTVDRFVADVAAAIAGVGAH